MSENIVTVTQEWDERECADCGHSESAHEGSCTAYHLRHPECECCSCEERCPCAEFVVSGRYIHYVQHSALRGER